MAKKNKNRSYWENRQVKWLNNQAKMDEQVLKKLEGEYQRTAKELEKEIAGYFQRYGKDNVIEFRTLMQSLDKTDRDLLFQDMEAFAEKYPEHAHLLPVRESVYKLNRLQGLHYSTQVKLLELGAIEQAEVEKHLEATYGKRYKELMKELGIGHNFLSMDNELMRSTIYDRWINGEDFRNRAWTNKEKLLNHLTTAYRDGIARGDNYNKLTEEVMKKFGVGYNDARRLVWTEASFVLNQSHVHAYQSINVEEYEISAVMDKKTSKICREMDGEVFRFDEMVVGQNFPPFHPYCRTSFIGILEERPDPEPAPKEVEEKTTEEFVEATSIVEANNYAVDELGLKGANYKGMSVQAANEWNKGLKDTFERFPELKKHIHFTGDARERNKLAKKAYYEKTLEELRRLNPNAPEEVLLKHAKRGANKFARQMGVSKRTFAQSWSPKNEIFKDLAGVTLNSDWGKDYDKMVEALKQDVESKFHPVGTDTIRSVLDHEIGHQLDDLLGIASIDEIKEMYDTRNGAQLTEDLSTYTWRNDNPARYSEMIAEGWAEYTNNPKPRPMAERIGQIIEEVYDRKFGK